MKTNKTNIHNLVMTAFLCCILTYIGGIIAPNAVSDTLKTLEVSSQKPKDDIKKTEVGKGTRGGASLIRRMNAILRDKNAVHDDESSRKSSSSHPSDAMDLD